LFSVLVIEIVAIGYFVLRAGASQQSETIEATTTKQGRFMRYALVSEF